MQWIPGIVYFSVEVAEASSLAAKLTDYEWEKLFLVPVKKLQTYSERIISYYEKLSNL